MSDQEFDPEVDVRPDILAYQHCQTQKLNAGVYQAQDIA